MLSVYMAMHPVKEITNFVEDTAIVTINDEMLTSAPEILQGHSKLLWTETDTNKLLYY